MATKINNIEELRKQKALLKKEVNDLESIITFENTKESLSAFTNGFTDRFLTETIDHNGETSLALKTGNIVKGISQSISERNKKKSLINFDNKDLEDSLIESTLKLGSVAFVSNLARKNLKSTNWKNKAIGLALVYVLPVALKFLRNKLEDYQRQQSVRSIEKLI